MSMDFEHLSMDFEQLKGGVDAPLRLVTRLLAAIAIAALAIIILLALTLLEVRTTTESTNNFIKDLCGNNTNACAHRVRNEESHHEIAFYIKCLLGLPRGGERDLAAEEACFTSNISPIPEELTGSAKVHEDTAEGPSPTAPASPTTHAEASPHSSPTSPVQAPSSTNPSPSPEPSPSPTCILNAGGICVPTLPGLGVLTVVPFVAVVSLLVARLRKVRARNGGRRSGDR